MRLIKADAKYNINHLHVVISFSISILFSLFIGLICSGVISHLIVDSENQFKESCKRITDGYEKSIALKLETYQFALQNFIKEELADCESSEEYQKHIIESENLNHPDFMNVSFVNLEGKGFAQNNSTYDASNRDYYNAIVDKKYETYVSEPILSLLNNEPVTIIAKAIRNSKGELKGLLTASIKLSSLNSIIRELTINEDGYLFILNEDGKFIYHPNNKKILTSFIPEDPKYIKLSSVYIAKKRVGEFRTKNVNGEDVTIFIRPIEHTNWMLGLSVPQSTFFIFKQRQNRYRLLIVLIGIVTMLILTSIESQFIYLLQRHQHIESHYDSLTNLWTRKKFEIEASKFIKRNPKSKIMLMEGDIRGFKFMNQNYGEESADKMIVFFSRICNHMALKYHGICGRGFADHIYMIVKVPSVRVAMNEFKAELNIINEKTKSYKIPFNTKYGISFIMPENKDKNSSAQLLISQASFAKSTIKDNILTQYSIYNSRLLNKINQERFIEDHMEDALAKKEFFVMYQPKINLQTDKIVGAEALVRWQSSELGLMAPNDFIPLFERNGFVTKLDFYVYEEVFKFMEKQIAVGNKIVPISVNMSRNHSKPDKFMHDFLEVFKKYSIPSNLIQVEIIERSMMDNNTLKEITNSLHKEGFSVAMDDFGTGESSLNMLTKIPVDVLKFDREFLMSSTQKNGEMDKKSANFIEILIEMSKALDKETVFEGVETQAQRDFLKSINCDEAQGFFYSKPLSQQDFIEFIKMHS